jgi:uncharacterized protein (TIGR00369 family)
MKDNVEIDPDRLWRGWQKHTPFESLVWMELEAHDKDAGTATLRLPYKPEYRRTDKPPTGYHGGAIATLIDVAGDFVTAIANNSGGVPTINLSIDYLRSADEVDLLAHARVRRSGRTIAVVDIDVEEPNGRLIAIGRGTYSTKTG